MTKIGLSRTSLTEAEIWQRVDNPLDGPLIDAARRMLDEWDEDIENGNLPDKRSIVLAREVARLRQYVESREKALATRNAI